jgi:hypothetical protein
MSEMNTRESLSKNEKNIDSTYFRRLVMKKVLLVVVVIMFAASMALAQASAGSDLHLAQHDILANGVDQGCRSCHIPHGGSILYTASGTTYQSRSTVYGTAAVDDSSTGAFKLWDKNLSQASYTEYSSDNIVGGQLAAAGSTAASWHSYLCFSCHDGAVATINLGSGFTMDPASQLVNNNRQGDTDLTNDHPVDVAWPTLTGTELGNGNLWGTDYETATAVKAASGWSGGWTPTSTLQPMPLYTATNIIECSTCHNVHMQASPTINVRGNFLRETQTDNTSLCRACHLSKR